MRGQTRKKIQKKLKIRGYSLKTDGLDEILSFVNRFQDAEDEAIDLLLDQLDHQSSVKSSIIDKEAVHQVVSLLLDAEAAEEESPSSSHSSIRVVDAFLIPKFRYDPIKKHFFQHAGSLPFHGEASAKAALYRDRLLLLFQRVSRDQHFIKPAFDTDVDTSPSCQLSTIQSLVGQRGRRWVMGVISQLEDGHFYLEDLTAAVEIDFSKAISFDLIAYYLEKRAVNDMFVILSDIWLDNEQKVMEKLETVLNGFENVEIVPSLFVFMGDFCSHPCNLSFHSFSSLRSQFGKLGRMIEAHPRLKEQSKFLFIPGPNDTGPSTVLPRCALPKYLTEELQKHVPNAIFSSNPCRVKFYTQEMVFFRQDLLYRMRRSCLIPPSTEETDDPFEHLVATITHQSHLCPLPLFVQPIIWNYDHCLHLYPTPHTIVLGDRSEQKAFKYTGITCFNPGSFSDDSTFVAYRPCTQEVEFSAL
ncbi:hypothetical protein Goshw_007575 [Gossypium schwendimanii]|uniref:DNA polymerase II subunit 2 n=1 Tax=Gossypium schwendimanii TaxID=34291 RepID=A0A7J9M1Q2_GOSSC|nr:hypothetical protein [Gossypium schwendimanii]